MLSSPFRHIVLGGRVRKTGWTHAAHGGDSDFGVFHIYICRRSLQNHPWRCHFPKYIFEGVGFLSAHGATGVLGGFALSV